MDIDGDRDTGILVGDGDDSLAILVAKVLLHTEHDSRRRGASGLRIGPGLAPGGCRHGNPVAAGGDADIVADIALHVDRDGAAGHIHIEGSLVGLEDGGERLVDGYLDLGASIFIADGDDSIAILIAWIFLDPQYDGLRSGSPALLTLSRLLAIHPRLRGSRKGDPVAVVRNHNIVADIRLEVHSDGTALHRHVEGGIVDGEHGGKRLADGDGYRDAGIFIADGDNDIPVVIALVLLHIQRNDRRLHAPRAG